jgi:hypothetical protein
MVTQILPKISFLDEKLVTLVDEFKVVEKR